MRAWEPVFRSLFGVGLDEYMAWNFDRFLAHKAFAIRELIRRGDSALLTSLGVPVSDG